MYVSFYAHISESLQRRKTLLLKNEFKQRFQKKIFSKRTMLNETTNQKYEVYEQLQHIFNQSSFLIHFDSNKSIYIDVNASKRKNFDVMIFHVKNDSSNEFICRTNVQSIMFLNKQLSDAESRYWPIELKMIGVI